MIKKSIVAAALLTTLFNTQAIAQDRVIEMRADRVFIYPQRMELTGEETLMDILMMYPDLIQNGWDNYASSKTGWGNENCSYNVRIDNSPINADNRLVLNQIKAKYVSRVQICDNTGVAKGTGGMNRVIDINLLPMEKGTHGFVGAQSGENSLQTAHAEARIGSGNTDIYATASYDYKDLNNTLDHKQYLSAHMTNKFSSRDKLLTYFTQQYTSKKNYGGQKKNVGEKYLARARYFHTFNDMGTELLTVGSYQYSTNPETHYIPTGDVVIGSENTTYIGILELNTPLFTKDLSMMLGWEGDFSYTSYNDPKTAVDQSYNVTNNDIYLQFNYIKGNWRFTVGDRLMFFHYGLNGMKESKEDVRNHIEASVINSIGKSSQLQLAYHRKFINPSYGIKEEMTTDQWIVYKDGLNEKYVDETKLSYIYSKPKLTINAATSYLSREGASDMIRLNTSAYYKTGILAVNAGLNYYTIDGDNNDITTFRLSPTVFLPCSWNVSGQAIIADKRNVLACGGNTYYAVQVSKTFGSHWAISADWHDISSKKYSAVMGTAKYLF